MDLVLSHLVFMPNDPFMLERCFFMISASHIAYFYSFSFVLKLEGGKERRRRRAACGAVREKDGRQSNDGFTHDCSHTHPHTHTRLDVLVSADDGMTGVVEGNSIGIKFDLPAASHQPWLPL